MSRKSDAEGARFDLIIVTPHMGEGGTQRVIATLAEHWNARGLRIAVISLFSDSARYVLPAGVRQFNVHTRLESVASAGIADRLIGVLTIFGLGYYAYFMRLIRSLRGLLRELDAPVILAMIGETNLITLLAARGLGMRVVISERNDPQREKLEGPWQWLRPKLYHWADGVTANTRHALAVMADYVPESKLALVENPVAPEFQSMERPDRDSRLILSIGRLHRQKGQDVLIDALARLPESLAAWRLALVGTGEEEAALKSRVARHGLEDRVDWLGYLEQPLQAYRQAAIFVLPSRYEGQSNALIEAMACGLPVIVSDACEGARDLLEDGVNGLVVTNEDDTQLAQAISRLAENPQLRASLGEEARKRAQAYSLERVLEQWEQVLGLS
ncbi:MAG: glycosyltransferase family 4 protein [Gammaproteobacteria bacterium]